MFRLIFTSWKYVVWCVHDDVEMYKMVLCYFVEYMKSVYYLFNNGCNSNVDGPYF